MTTRRLSDLRGPQIDELVTPESILIQPVGAIEQHGPHLPLSTDLVVARAAGEALVDQAGDDLDLWLLEPLAYSKSNEHAWSAGTVWLSADTLLKVIDDVGRCVATTRAQRLVFLNGHGGNSALLNMACRELRLAHGLKTFLTHLSVPPDQGGASPEAELGMGIHAGLMETSIMLHLRPDLCDMALAEANVPAKLAANEHVRFGGSVSFGWLSNDFGPDGQIGDPTGADAELGKRHFEAAIDHLVAKMAEVRDFDFGR